MSAGLRAADLAGPWHPDAAGSPHRSAGGTPPEELTEVLAAVGAALRAGRSLPEAWRSLGVRAVDGVPAAGDLARLDGAGPAHVTAVRAVCRLTGDAGAPPAAVLDRLLTVVAADVAAERARSAALAGPTTTARLLAGLPLVGLVLAAALGADPVAVALDGGWGTLAAAAGAVLSGVGHLWAGRLVRSAARAGEEA